MLSQINTETKRRFAYINPATGVAVPGPWPRKGKTERDRARGANAARFANRDARVAWQKDRAPRSNPDTSFPGNGAGGKGNSSKARKH